MARCSGPGWQRTFGCGRRLRYENACPLSSDTILPDRAIAVMWDDLAPEDFGDLAYFQAFATCPVGPAEPCAVVEYQGFHLYNVMPPALLAGTFEVVLFRSGSVLMQYQDAGDQQGASATIGIKGTSGFGVELACNTAGSLSDGLAVCFHKPGSGECTP